ncbi:hypothetical protein [Armatimonas sp.]|uniref:hypothetical protein n=1 Tax=Armatimonas sp. TaxID=1872638 RepID=UPI0037507B26
MRVVGGGHGAGHGGSETRASLSLARSSGAWQSLVALGQRMHQGTTHHAILLESANISERGTLFGRAEWVQNDELPGNSSGKPITKLTLGAVKNLNQTTGIGASLSMHQTPTALRPVYGTAPWSANIFLRVRTPRM